MTRAERPDDFVEDPAPGEADDVVLVAEVVTLEVVESEDTEENDTVNDVVEVVLAEVDGAPDEWQNLRTREWENGMMSRMIHESLS